jgi:hypothetical protein
MESFARIMIIGGLLLLAGGGLLYLLSRTGLPLGHLPGDIHIQTQNFSCFFPLATMIILSAVLTIVLNVAARLLKK